MFARARFLSTMFLCTAAAFPGCSGRLGPLPADLNAISAQLAASADLREVIVPASFTSLSLPRTIAFANLQIPDCRSADVRNATEIRPLSAQQHKSLSRIPGAASLVDEAPAARYIENDRRSAAQLLDRAGRAGADWLVLFTYSDEPHSEFWIGPVALLTLGFFPNAMPSVISTSRALLIDVHERRVLSSLEAAADGWQPSNFWGINKAQRQIAERTHSRAFDKLLDLLLEFTSHPSPTMTWKPPPRGVWPSD